MSAPEAQRSAPLRALRPSAKVLPEHARSHNRSLVLQNLYRGGLLSRADLARETGLTRVTISDLVAELIGDGLVVETGQREEGRPGKPAILLDINRAGHRIIGVDLSDTGVFRGAVLDLDGGIVTRMEAETDGAEGDEVAAIAVQLVRDLVAAADA
ncbi:MarR family transcriptional regulator, partial [Schumannella luteola]